MIGDVSWSTPGQSSADSLPLGNGDIAANVWTEPDGGIGCYLAKNDAWDGLGRLIKVGLVRLHLDPPLLAQAGNFEQKLSLEDASVVISRGGTTVRLWLDAHWPRLVVEVSSASPCSLEARIDAWRSLPKALDGKGLHAALGLDGGPVPLVAAADHLVGDPASLIWHQRNETSVWAFTLDQQGLGAFKARASDPLLHRTFGGLVSGEGMKPVDLRTLRSSAPARTHALTIGVHCARTATAAEWLDQIRTQVRAPAPTLAKSWRDHRSWWNEFWARSYIRIESLASEWDAAATISKHSSWQRYLVACCSRGLYPVKFNGGLFTADWALKDEPYDADYRRWGGGYWWQNTRLPYWAVLASGDHELLRPLFRMYRDMLPLAEERTRLWFRHGGVFFPETLFFWGTFLPSNYGWKRDGKDPADVENPYIGRLYVGGLELVALMLETHRHTRDAALLEQDLLPIARGVLRFYAEHYPRDPDGTLRIKPAQALETWWSAENPLPDVAGLRDVLAGLLALPAERIPDSDQTAWRELSRHLPALPTTIVDGQARFAPAEKHEAVPHNSENAELYGVFPFKLQGVGRPDLDAARRTFLHRPFPETGGWRQDALHAALLGLSEPAAYFVAKNFTQGSYAGARFPGFWGPNYDWVPDFDHGSVSQLALQAMLVQTVGEKIYLFPAWPAERWNVAFKLHVPGETTIEGDLRQGNLERLTVTPPERRKDVVVLLGL
ncbi:MAG: hypothetical protein JWM88_511 [Verrucomicrobia bacterium]|nr:hypothetical protein [Verrucomicrobiota bacterium]